ncbi:MAG: agmatinase [Erythrobacter sp.]
MTITLLGIPHDCNSSFLGGTAQAPKPIREAVLSDSANMFCEAGHDLGAPGVLDIADDLAVTALRGQSGFDEIFAGVTRHLDQGNQVISIGGDHSISYPAIMAHIERHGPLSVLHFDAHPDLYDDFEGNPFSHASPFARLMESGKVRRLVQVGIRTLNTHQREQAARFGVEQHEMRDLSDLDTLCFDGPLYISIDLDALDPAYAPGVSHHEPGGLSTRQVLDCIHKTRGRLIGGDVVEYNPTRDFNGVTAMVAAKLVKELAGRMLDDAV